MTQDELDEKANEWIVSETEELLFSVTDESCLDIPTSKRINFTLIRTRLEAALFAALHKGYELGKAQLE